MATKGMPSIGTVISNLFGSNSGATAQPPQNPNSQPTNQRENQQRNDQNNGIQKRQAPTGENTQLENIGAPNREAGNEGEAVNPMDKFKDIWQPPTDKDGKPKQSTKQSAIPSIDANKIMEFAGKQDFKKFVKPETLAAISKGGEEGMAAFAQAMQDIGSSTFASAVTASSQMMKAALERQAEQFESGLSERFTKFSLKENLGNKNPVLKHPAARPIVDALQSVLAQKYPDHSAADLQTTAEEFLTTFASSISGNKSDDNEEASGKGGKKQKSEDWSDFLPEQLR